MLILILFKIRMEFLRPILAKIELFCQQPATTAEWGPRVASQCLVQDRVAGGSWGGLAMSNNFN